MCEIVRWQDGIQTGLGCSTCRYMHKQWLDSGLAGVIESCLDEATTFSVAPEIQAYEKLSRARLSHPLVQMGNRGSGRTDYVHLPACLLAGAGNGPNLTLH